MRREIRIVCITAASYFFVAHTAAGRSARLRYKAKAGKKLLKTPGVKINLVITPGTKTNCDIVYSSLAGAVM